MTENKRFTIFGDWHKDYVIDEIRDNGDFITVGDVVDLLNELHEENITIKQTIQDMMENERTQIGKSVLKQLYEAIQ